MEVPDTKDTNEEVTPKYKPVRGSALNVIRSAELIDYSKIRAGLRKIIDCDSSKDYQNIFEVLENSYMGEFDFSKVEPEPHKPAEKQFALIKTDPNNLIHGVVGAKWNDMSGVSTVEANLNAMNERILEVLREKVPKTMGRFAYLSPKKVVEAKVLDGWLVDGFSLIYPNLNRQIRKYDATLTCF